MCSTSQRINAESFSLVAPKQINLNVAGCDAKDVQTGIQ